MKKILITGGNGFVGKNLSKYLKKYKYELFLVNGKIHIDLRYFSQVAQLPKCDLIIHLAADSFIPDTFENPQKFYENNILSMLNILEKAKLDNSSVIFLSSYVYGTPQYLPIDEKHPRSALNPYAQSKIICEDLCFAYNRDFNVPITIFRPFNIYGPNQKKSFFVSKVFSSIDQTEILLDNPKPKRDFIYIIDVLKAIHKAINKNSIQFNIYNLGSGKSISMKAAAETICKITNSFSKLKFNNIERRGEIFETVSDLQKIKKDLSWVPETSFSEGIYQMYLLSKTINEN